MSFLHIFALLFAVGNPIDDLPIFIEITKDKKASNVHLMIIIACLFSFGLSVLFLYSGMTILDAFDIGIEAFRIAGGLVILLLGLKLLVGFNAKKDEQEEEKEVKKQTEKEGLISRAFVPLAVPLLAGPEVISTVVLLASNSNVPDTKILIVLAFLALVDYIIFVTAGRLAKFLGDIGIEVISKLLSIIMIAMGIQYMLLGIGNTFPGLM